MFISGQIGLIPSSLSLPSPPSLGYETALACQHVERISKAVSETTGGWEANAQLIVYWHSNPDIATRVRQVLLDHVRLASVKLLSTCVHLDPQKPLQDGLACTLFIVVNELPRGALVEKQVVMHTGRVRKVDLEDGGISLESHRSVFSEGELLSFDLAKLDQTDWIWRSIGHTGWELILAEI